MLRFLLFSFPFLIYFISSLLPFPYLFIAFVIVYLFGAATTLSLPSYIRLLLIYYTLFLSFIFALTHLLLFYSFYLFWFFLPLCPWFPSSVCSFVPSFLFLPSFLPSLLSFPFLFFFFLSVSIQIVFMFQNNKSNNSASFVAPLIWSYRRQLLHEKKPFFSKILPLLAP